MRCLRHLSTPSKIPTASLTLELATFVAITISSHIAANGEHSAKNRGPSATA